MSEHRTSAALHGRRVLIPGGTGGVGEGVVRNYLAAGADVIVPTRTQERADEFLDVLADVATDQLHLLVHDYTTLPAAETLASTIEDLLGGIDDVVAPIGGWWAGKRLWEIDEADWQSAFVGLATAHMAVLRACLPRMTRTGAYSLVVGDSSAWPVPGSGLVSMEQAAVLMMQRVAHAEAEDEKRVFALVLGQVTTRLGRAPADQDHISADEVGRVAVAASATTAPGQEVALHSKAEVQEALATLHSAGSDKPDARG